MCEFMVKSALTPIYPYSEGIAGITLYDIYICIDEGIYSRKRNANDHMCVILELINLGSNVCIYVKISFDTNIFVLTVDIGNKTV